MIVDLKNSFYKFNRIGPNVSNPHENKEPIKTML